MLDTGLYFGPDEGKIRVFHGRQDRDGKLEIGAAFCFHTNKSGHITIPCVGQWNTFLAIPWKNMISTGNISIS